MNQIEALIAIRNTIDVWVKAPCSLSSDPECKECAAAFIGTIAAILSQTTINDLYDKPENHASELVQSAGNRLAKRPYAFRIPYKDTEKVNYHVVMDEDLAQNMSKAIHGDPYVYDGLYLRDGKPI